MRHYQENVQRIIPKKVKALLLVDNAPAHAYAEKLVCADGKIRTMFLPPSATSIMQPMVLGVIMSCKRFYRRKFLDEVLVVIEEEDDLKADTRGQRTLRNIKTYNIDSAIYYFTSAGKDVNITTFSNSWKKLMLDEDPDLDFKGFEPNDFHQTLLRAGERSQCRRC